MSTDSLITLAIAIFLFGASPGPGIFAVVARALSSGFGLAMALTMGLILGDLIWLAATVSGLAVLAKTMGEMFIILKIIGGLYLVWLGVKVWRTPVVGIDPTTVVPNRRGMAPLSAFVAGVAVTLSNPKAILFYLALLPTFLDLDAVSPGGLVATGAVIALVLLIVCGTYAFLASRARRVFQSGKAMRRLNRVSGALMVGAGVFVATR